MNNEPVAWINIEDGISNLDWDKYEFAQKHIPLYTHPIKELTKELDALLCSVMGEAYLGEEKEQALVNTIRQQYTHPVKEHFEDELQAEELHGILQSYNEPLNYEVTHPRWSKENEMFASWEYPQKTYADGIEECAQRAEAYAYMSPNFTALAEELRAILRKAQEKC